MEKSCTINPLKRARFLSGKRAIDCAALLNKSQPMYSLMENGIRPFSVSDAKRLSEFLGVPMGELFAKGPGDAKG